MSPSVKSPKGTADAAKKKIVSKASRTTKNFEEEFAKLDPAQRRAVETIEGPVMVIAGPGTGKTQVVSMRVANILRKTQMRPSNILCLTFSVSGATAMRDRLRQLIGPDAYGVTVSTIHGFAQSVIDQHPATFEEWSIRTQLTDIDRYRELHSIIDTLAPHSALINPKDPYFLAPDLLMRISQVKREGKTIEDLERAADAHDIAMGGKSKPGTKAHGKNMLQARKFRDFLEIFRSYQAMLLASGRYDYDDMILTLLRAFREEDWLLAGLQERFQYVLVDEFQDTNGAQWRLIDGLTSFGELKNEPNLFVVGDDDQAIYRFQGANIANMLSFLGRFPAAPVIPLTVSYRSSQEILDASEAVIAHNTERLAGKVAGLQKHLTAHGGSTGMQPTLLRPPSDSAEPWFIADMVEERLAAGVKPEEIGVLTQTNRELFPLYDTLRARNIPVLLDGKADLLTHPLVSQALAILAAIEKPRNDGLLAAALASDCFGLMAADLGRIHSAARARGVRLHDVLLGLETDRELALTQKEKLMAVRDVLEKSHQKIPVRTVLETLENTLMDCGLLCPTQGPTASPERNREASSILAPLDLAAIEEFFRHVKERCLENPRYTFRDFSNDLSFYADPRIGDVRLTYTLPHLVVSGVQLMTAHQSKGREFSTVILVNFRDGHWDKRKNVSKVSVPEDLLFGWGKDQKDFERSQDERRVAYVAMTRAKRELFFSCPREQTVGQKSRAIAPSAFFAEAGTLPEASGSLRNPEAASLLLHPVTPDFTSELTAYLRERLENFALSATTLRRFLDDPQEFLRIDLLEQPQHFEDADLRRFAYGSAVHWALRQWAAARKNEKPFTREQFLEAFAWYLEHKTILTEKQWQNLASFGQETLARYFDETLAPGAPFLYAVERDFHARLGDIPLKGKIDRIDLASATSGIATVIDYKTGKPKSESVIRGGLEPGTVSRTVDGDNFRQLTFYAVLLEQADPLLRPEAFVLDFLGERGEDPIRRVFAVTQREKDDLKKLIRDVWAKVIALDFTPL